jgi:hypothetical protein
MRVSRGGGHCVDWRSGVGCLSGLGDDSIEPVVMVSGIMDSTGGAVRFKQAVVPLDFVPITLLSLLLDVMGMAIINSVLEFVISRSLDKIFR